MAPPTPTFWATDGRTFVWFKECQSIVARHYGEKDLAWIAERVQAKARALNTKLGRPQRGPEIVTESAVMFCVHKLGLVTHEEYAAYFESNKRASHERSRKRRQAILTKHDETTYLSNQLREKVVRRDGKLCQYCGSEATSLDHVVAVGAGGKTEASNLVACCRSCNASKGNKILPEPLQAYLLAAIQQGRTVEQGWPPLWEQVCSEFGLPKTKSGLKVVFRSLRTRAMLFSPSGEP